MAVGTDRVQLLKQESTDLGGDDADIGVFGSPVPINPQEDAVETAGVYVQDASNRDEAVYVARNGNDLVFKDPLNTEKTLTELSSSGSGLSHQQVLARVSLRV